MKAIWGATERTLSNTVRKEADFVFGELAGQYLGDFLPNLSDGERSTAAATCRIQIMGAQSHIHNGDSQRNPKQFKWSRNSKMRWAHVRMNTQGHCPTDEFSALKNLWVKADRHSAVSAVLVCFDLTIDDLFEQFGEPAEDDRLVLDLSEIIRALAPDLLVAIANVAVA